MGRIPRFATTVAVAGAVGLAGMGLGAGARPADLNEDELLAFDVTKALVGGAGPVPGPLYDAAVAKLGQEGFDAIIFITIHYLALGVMLNAYDVPVGRPVSQL